MLPLETFRKRDEYFKQFSDVVQMLRTGNCFAKGRLNKRSQSTIGPPLWVIGFVSNLEYIKLRHLQNSPDIRSLTVGSEGSQLQTSSDLISIFSTQLLFKEKLFQQSQLNILFFSDQYGATTASHDGGHKPVLYLLFMETKRVTCGGENQRNHGEIQIFRTQL